MEVDCLMNMPRGWVTTRLGEIAHIRFGQSPPSSSYNDKGEGYPFFQGKADFKQLYPIVTKWCISPRVIANSGDILISVRAPVGPTNLCNQKSCIGRGLAAITPLGNIPSLYILYYLRYKESKISKIGSGSTFNAITRKELESIPIQIAPLDEQKRIVNEIINLFLKIDNILKYLNQAKVYLIQYRQSILKQAFQGEFTKKWREDKSFLIMKKKDIHENKDIVFDSKLNYDSFIPKEWYIIKLGEIAKVNPRVLNLTNTIPDNFYVSFIPMKNVEEETGKIDTSIIKNYADVKSGYTPFIEGDILFAKITPCMENGKIAIANNLHNGIGFGSTEFHVIRLFRKELLNKYIFFYLIQKRFRNIAQRFMKGSAGQLRIPTKYLEDVLIPIPSPEEQQLIVNKIENIFSLIDIIEDSVKKNLMYCNMLRLSILKKSFDGKLTYQNSHDEPAIKLIERIKREKILINEKSSKKISDPVDDSLNNYVNMKD